MSRLTVVAATVVVVVADAVEGRRVAFLGFPEPRVLGRLGKIVGPFVTWYCVELTDRTCCGSCERYLISTPMLLGR